MIRGRDVEDLVLGCLGEKPMEIEVHCLDAKIPYLKLDNGLIKISSVDAVYEEEVVKKTHIERKYFWSQGVQQEVKFKRYYMVLNGLVMRLYDEESYLKVRSAYESAT
jgi:hypothetical protein